MIFLRNYFNANQSPMCEISMKKSVADVGSSEESKDELTTVTIKKLIPPVSRVNLIESSHTYDEEEVDSYEEISKQWRCDII